MALLLTTAVGAALVSLRGPWRGSRDIPEASPDLSLAKSGSIPAGALTQLQPSDVAVDSSYSGYSEKALTSGIIDVRRVGAMRYNVANWASVEIPEPHWIELSFERTELIAALYIYWGFDHKRFMPSRSVELQLPQPDGSWQTIANVEPGELRSDRILFSPCSH